MSPEGWAWLVCGRRLFVWKYKQNDMRRSCCCYELQLPPSDLAHKADLVCVLDNSQNSQSVPSTIAVTPEGIVRFWPNIAYEGHSIESIASDLQGQECASLTDIQPYGCILGTTTSSLVHITVNNIEGQNTIICRTLKAPQGVLAGFGRRVTSLLFGSMPATQSSESKQLFKVVRSHSSNLSDELYIWVLSSVSAQKWLIIDEHSERLIEDMDLERPVKDAFLDKVWNRETTHPNQLKIWLIDIGFTKTNEMVLLVAGLNADVSNQLYYAVLTFSHNESRPEPNISFNSFTVLRNHTVCYVEEEEEQLLNLHLLSGTINSQMVYIYSTSQTIDEDILQTDDKLKALKKAFVLFSKGDRARSQYLVKELFPPITTAVESDRLDDSVVALSADLCDQIPHSDPRWAESGSQNQYSIESLTASVIIANQIDEKLKSHRILIEFLKTCNLWERLSSVTVKGSTTVQTKLMLSEHIEKLIACLTLRRLHNEYNNILETAIKIVLSQRNDTLQTRLTPQDIFYRQTTRVEELITALIEYESQQIDSNAGSSRDLLNCLLSVKVCHFRQTQGSLYEWSALSKCEYIPWTSTVGVNGMRTSLVKQFEFLVNYGIESTNTSAVEDDIQLKGAICQKMVDLSDIILDGFVCQLKSIDNTNRYQTVERNFESCRAKCIEPLMRVKQYDRAAALAEKYDHFDALIEICEQLNDSERLRRYIADFANKGFAEYLFKWYLKEGKQGKMLTMSASLHTLTNFLKNHQQLNWLHQIHLDQFPEASHTLRELAQHEQNYLSRKKTLLSLSKLSALAAGLPPPSDIDSELELILYQENLSPEIMAKSNLDFNSMRVLSPREMIELYMSETDTEMDAINLKKALDLTEYIVDSTESREIVTNILCSAISRD
ncbi:unnamed protein product, partial [Oppiella nova]